MLVRVRACGICGSDVHGFDGSTGRRVPPLVMGHEAAGDDRAESATVFAALRQALASRSTPRCPVDAANTVRAAQMNLCEDRRVLGVSCAEYRRHGAFAEFIAVPAGFVYPLPEAMPFEHAALIEAVSVAVHAVDRRVPDRASPVVVIGCGMIGLLVIQILRARGCERVIAVDVDSRRLSMASQLGAADGVDATSDDVLAAIARVTGPRGADHAFEVVGRAETVDAAVRCVRKGGTVTLVGNLSPTVAAAVTVRRHARDLLCSDRARRAANTRTCIDLMMRGAVDVGPLISATAPLEEGPAWFDRLHRGGAGLMKVILRP